MIVCFSASGNTRWVARRVAEAAGDRVVDMAEALRGDCCLSLRRGEALGVAFPVHGWREPRLVRAFLEKVSLSLEPATEATRQHAGERPYVYLLLTCGDDIGLTPARAARLLAANDSLRRWGYGSVSSAFCVRMPETYVCLPFMTVDKAPQAAAKVKAAAGEVAAVAQAVVARQRGLKAAHESRWPRINTHVLGAAFARWLVSDGPFRVSSSRCTRCGKCRRVCPTANIEATADGLPRWKHDGSCTACMACYHHCPARAIDWGRFTSGKGQWTMDERRQQAIRTL